MEIFQHDSARTFRFVLRGDLAGSWVRELEQRWITAQSIMHGKELLVEVSSLDNADEAGMDLLSRMRDAGARLTTSRPARAPQLLQSLGLPAPTPAPGAARGSFMRILRLVAGAGSGMWRRSNAELSSRE